MLPQPGEDVKTLLIMIMMTTIIIVVTTVVIIDGMIEITTDISGMTNLPEDL